MTIDDLNDMLQPSEKDLRRKEMIEKGPLVMTHKDLFKGTTYDSLNKQVDGNHYSKMKIQPAEFINENNLLFAEGNAIKYICRHNQKANKKILKKLFTIS